MPIPFFAFREIYEELARQEWAEMGELPTFELVDKALVLSALAHPFATAGGEETYPTVPAKAAALFRGLVKNHGLQDGNKRLAVTCLSVFLLANGWLPNYTNLQLYRYALKVARQEGAYPMAAIERWVRRNALLMPEAALAALREQNRAFAGPEALEIVFRPLLIERGSFRQVIANLEPGTKRGRRGRQNPRSN